MWYNGKRLKKKIKQSSAYGEIINFFLFIWTSIKWVDDEILYVLLGIMHKRCLMRDNGSMCQWFVILKWFRNMCLKALIRV